MQSVDAALTGRRLTVWSKTERRRGTCKFYWEEANCVVQDREKACHLKFGCFLGGAIKEEISFIVESD